MSDILDVLKDGYATRIEIAERLGRPPTTVAGQLQKLEAGGLVEKVPRGGVVFWKLTHASEPASDLVGQVEEAIQEVVVSDRLALIDELRQIEVRRIHIMEALK